MRKGEIKISFYQKSRGISGSALWRLLVKRPSDCGDSTAGGSPAPLCLENLPSTNETKRLNYANRKFGVEEGPGVSVFYRDASGDIFHTYSSYGRGLDILIGAYNYMDLVPKGRDEADLPWTMAWLRHHDRYES